MTYFERLVEAGIRPDCAMDTCHWFQTQGDESILKRYVEEVEEKLGKYKQAKCNVCVL